MPERSVAPVGLGRRTKEATMTTKLVALVLLCLMTGTAMAQPPRSEEHTSELQSRLHLVCRLLLEKKKKLSKLLGRYRETTRGQGRRLGEIFKMLKVSPQRATSESIDGLISEFVYFMGARTPDPKD